MKLLVPKRLHVDLLTIHELVKIAKLSTETRGCMILRKQRNVSAGRLERTKFVLEERVFPGLPHDVPGCPSALFPCIGRPPESGYRLASELPGW